MPVAFAARLKRLTDFAFPAFGLKSQSKRISGPATIARKPPNFDGDPPAINLQARGLRLYNRNSKAASIYKTVHETLGGGRG